MKSLHDKHMEMIDAVNNSTSILDHTMAGQVLYGWRKGVAAAGRSVDLIAADLEQEARGIDRPMCCGVFLDWKPEPL